MKKWEYLFSGLIKLIYLYLLGLFIFTLSRFLMIFSYGNRHELWNYKEDFFKAIWMGFRVDTQVLMYALALPLLLLLLSPVLIPAFKSYKQWNQIVYKTYVGVLFVFTLILIGNYYFFQQFKSNYNPLIYAAIEDDTSGILKIIWNQYPVILIFLLLGLYYFLLIKFSRYIFNKFSRWKFGSSYGPKIVFISLFLILFFIAMRGSLGLFPLGEKNLIVSNNTFINNLASNGVLSLKYALKNGKKNKFDLNISKTIEKYGFSSPEEALSIYLGKNIKKASPDLLFTKTPKNTFLEKNPPNIVFILMESMGDYYFDFHSEEMNLLGSLEEVMDSLYVSRYFLPKGPRTIQSLEGLIINNPRVTALSQGLYAQKTFEISNIKPFKQKAYKTIYATGGELGWRNIGNFFKKQYFDEVQGDFYLEKKYKNVKGGDWGIYDEYLFNSVWDQLNEKNKVPEFFFVMTTTNHPPYKIPDAYPKFPLKIPKNIQKKLIGNKKYAYKNFVTFQYANDQLGKFIKKILKSPLASNTIILITGDHTNTEFFNFKENEKFKETAVPFLAYIPKKYLKRISIKGLKTGSHKDIFPTLYNLALSEAKYVYGGENLFEAKDNFGLAINGLEIFPQGGAMLSSPPVYFKWGKNKTLEILKDSSKIPYYQKEIRKAKAYKASMEYLIQKELQTNKH